MIGFSGLPLLITNNVYVVRCTYSESWCGFQSPSVLVVLLPLASDAGDFACALSERSEGLSLAGGAGQRSLLQGVIFMQRKPCLLKVGLFWFCFIVS